MKCMDTIASAILSECFKEMIVYSYGGTVLGTNAPTRRAAIGYSTPTFLYSSRSTVQNERDLLKSSEKILSICHEKN